MEAAYLPPSIDESLPPVIKSKSDVIAAWEVFQGAVSHWDDSINVPLIVWRQGQARSLEALEPAIFALAEFVDDCEFSPDAWHIVLSIDRFLEKTFEWASSVKEFGDLIDPSGGPELWAAYKDVPLAIQFTISDNIEPVAQLLQLPQISPQQVAKIYGWKDKFGNWDVNKVEEEKLNPGRHTQFWRNPAKVAHERVTAESWKKRAQSHPDYAGRLHVFQGDAPQEEKSSPVASESFEELLALPGMTLEQCAKMKQVSIEEVQAIAKELAILNPNIASLMSGEVAASHLRVDPAKLHASNMLESTRMDTYPELELNERIWAMSDDGHNPGRITAGLRAHHALVSYEQVLAVLARKPSLTGPTNGEVTPEKTEDGTETPKPAEASGGSSNSVKPPKGTRAKKTTTRSR